MVGVQGTRSDSPQIVERAQKWKLRPPGKVVEKIVPRAELHYESGQVAHI